MNQFGELFRVTTWGESHGRAVGAVIDGCPAGLFLDQEELTSFLAAEDRPIPALATSRNEPNQVEFLSGVAEGSTIGTPICLVIPNQDIRPGDYDDIRGIFRPGHGDYTYYLKHGCPEQTGGGRSSGRECIARVAAGYVALKVLQHLTPDLSVQYRIVALAGLTVMDEASLSAAVERAGAIARRGDSSGGQIEVRATGVPGGLGEPVFGGLDALLAGALMGIGAVKTVEVGLAPAGRSGSEYHDQFCEYSDGLSLRSNNAGGVLSGISTGQDLVVRVSVKPTPSMVTPTMGGTTEGKTASISVKGRHDLNITPRIGPVAVAMVALVLVDLMMRSGRLSRDRLP